MYFEHDELPRHESQNNFFVYEFTTQQQKEIGSFARKAKARLGHYIRTELVSVFEQIKASGMFEDNRYSIPCPITELEKKMFQRNITSTQLFAEEIYESLVNGVTIPRPGTKYEGIASVPAGRYIQFSELKALIKHDLDITDQRRAKAIIKKLQEMEYLGSESLRTRDARIGFMITPRNP